MADGMRWMVDGRFIDPRPYALSHQPSAMMLFTAKPLQSRAFFRGQGVEKRRLPHFESRGRVEHPACSAGRRRGVACGDVRVWRDAEPAIGTTLFVQIDRNVRAETIQRGADRGDASGGCRSPGLGPW